MSGALRGDDDHLGTDDVAILLMIHMPVEASLDLRLRPVLYDEPSVPGTNTAIAEALLRSADAIVITWHNLAAQRSNRCMAALPACCRHLHQPYGVS
jgi:hypothetical protein